jgi:hypothetical protein
MSKWDQLADSTEPLEKANEDGFPPADFRPGVLRLTFTHAVFLLGWMYLLPSALSVFLVPVFMTLSGVLLVGAITLASTLAVILYGRLFWSFAGHTRSELLVSDADHQQLAMGQLATCAYIAVNGSFLIWSPFFALYFFPNGVRFLPLGLAILVSFWRAVGWGRHPIVAILALLVSLWLLSVTALGLWDFLIVPAFASGLILVGIFGFALMVGLALQGYSYFLAFRLLWDGAGSNDPRFGPMYRSMGRSFQAFSLALACFLIAAILTASNHDFSGQLPKNWSLSFLCLLPFSMVPFAYGRYLLYESTCWDPDRAPTSPPHRRVGAFFGSLRGLFGRRAAWELDEEELDGSLTSVDSPAQRPTLSMPQMANPMKDEVTTAAPMPIDPKTSAVPQSRSATPSDAAPISPSSSSPPPSEGEPSPQALDALDDEVLLDMDALDADLANGPRNTLRNGLLLALTIAAAVWFALQVSDPEATPPETVSAENEEDTQESPTSITVPQELHGVWLSSYRSTDGWVCPEDVHNLVRTRPYGCRLRIESDRVTFEARDKRHTCELPPGADSLPLTVRGVWHRGSAHEVHLQYPVHTGSGVEGRIRRPRLSVQDGKLILKGFAGYDCVPYEPGPSSAP